MIIKYCAIALLCAFVAFFLSELGWKGKRLFSVVGLCCIIGLVLPALSDILSSIMDTAKLSGISEAAECSLKILGVGYVFGISSDICREVGEGAIATALGICARTEIFILVYPFLKETISYGMSLLK